MNKEEDITNWEKDAPLLASLKKENSFVVPEFYFEKLSEEIINQIKIEELAGKNSFFKTPEDYFQNLASKIESEIILEERKDLLKANHAGFETPYEYFEISKAEIINKIGKNKTSFRRSRFVGRGHSYH